MKTKFILLAFATLALLCSCSKEESRPSSKRFTLVSDPSAVATKAKLSDGTGFAWSTEDLSKVGVAYTADESAYTHTTSSGGSISEDGVASISATLSADATKAYAYFPAGDCTERAALHTYSFPASRALLQAGVSDDLPLASDAFDVSGNLSSAQVSFHTVGALLRFFVYSSTGSSESVESIAVNANSAISGDYLYDFASKSGSVSGSSQQLTLSLATTYDLSGVTSATASSSIIAPILPCSTSWIDYLVTTDKNIYTFHSTSQRDFTEGNVTEVKLNLDKATSVSARTNKQQLTYHFTDKGNGMSGKLNLSVDYGGVSNSDLGWFIVAVDGVENTDYSQVYYTDITSSSEEVSWARAFMGGTNNVYVSVDENTGTSEREADLNVYFNETDDYVAVATAKNSSGTIETISSTDPILTIHISQKCATSKAQVIYDFYTVDWSWVQQMFSSAGNFDSNPILESTQITSEGGTLHCGGQYRVSVDGTWNSNWTGLDFTGDAIDANGDTVSWVSEVSVSGGKLYFTLSKNDTGNPRSATVRLFANDDSTHEVVGTYYASTYAASGNGVSASVKTISASNPVFTLNITQPAAE